MRLLKIISALIVVLLIISAASCGRQVRAEEICGTYTRPNDTFGEYDKFSITLNNDGTYSYYETWLSSMIGMGNYTFDGKVVTLTHIVSVSDDADPKNFKSKALHFKFKADGKTLVYLGNESDNFTYVKLTDGAVFER